MLPTFPISDLLPSIQEAISQNDELLLIAPPGAGKTTLVPLALLDGFSELGKIIIIEPRRIAARTAAMRMAEILEESVGETVGFRVRLQTQVSAATKIEVITEGVFLRMLQDDPSLEDVSLVIFDEFHERSLNSDLALALTLNSKLLFSDLRESPLKLIVMSATLDSQGLSGALSSYLNKTVPVLESPGKSFPVEIVYSAKNYSTFDVYSEVYGFVTQALSKTDENVLVFLPGISEINRVKNHLEENSLQHYFGGNSVEIFALHGGLSLDAQNEIVKPKDNNKNARRVILSTSIAQTSLTIPGITAVVDTGLVRLPEFDAKTTTTRLVTKLVSKATAKQRTGRAGRLGPGVCFRMWSEEKDYQLPEFDTPEILSSDLTDLLLQIKAWGIDDVSDLFWLDAPPKHLLGASITLLNDLGAFKEGQLTPLGEQMVLLPVAPRLAKMLLVAKAMTVNNIVSQRNVRGDIEKLACNIAALIQDYKLKGNSADLFSVIESMSQSFSKNNRDLSASLKIAQQLMQLVKNLSIKDLSIKNQDNLLNLEILNSAFLSPVDVAKELVAFLLVQAFPDRIAKKVRGEVYKLANGRGAVLDELDPLIASDWLVVIDLGGQKNQSRDRIYSAVALPKTVIENSLSYLQKNSTDIRWNDSDGRFVAVNTVKVGAIVLKETPVENITSAQRVESLIDWFKSKGETALNWVTWDDNTLQWRQRVQLLKTIDPDSNWPDVSNAGLMNSIELWLEPYIANVSNLSQLKDLSMTAQLSSLLDWQQSQTLDELLPEKITVPSGSKISIDYQQNPPILAVKLQEMFGLDATPTLANGKVSLSIHLLSPARRPLQITQDLAGFWKGSYQEVRKEMKGRYPKHHWPEDPYSIAPTARAKPRK